MRKKILLAALLFFVFTQLLTVSAAAAMGAFSVTFDPNYDGAVSVSAAIGSGMCAADAVPEDPIRIGYAFNGWYLEKECVNEFDAEAPITRDLTVYACWKRPLEYCDAEGNVFICERYKEITGEHSEFNCTEDTVLTFADGCTETDSILLNGEVTYCLILKDGQSVSAYNVALGNGTSIEIYGQPQGNGTLTLRSESFGIGVWEDHCCGNITVNGGIIRSSTFYGACIGTAESKSDPFENHPCGCGDITVNGGTIHADSVMGACIGSGYASGSKSYVGNITINGGDLYLTDSDGACIGTGSADRGMASCGGITINGGTLHMDAMYSAAIGGGSTEKGYINSGDVQITGGTISAGGFYGPFVKNVNDLTISGGTITADCEINMAVSVKNRVTITGGDVTLTGKSPYQYNLVNCAEAYVDPKLMILCGSSESDSMVSDRIDLPDVRYVRIVTPNPAGGAYDFSVEDNNAFAAVNREDGSKTVLRLSDDRFEYDGDPLGPVFDRNETIAWFSETGTHPSVQYYLSDGTTLTTPWNSGADVDGGRPSQIGDYVIRAELETPDGVLSFAMHFYIYQIVQIPFSQTEITIRVGETDDSITYSGPIARYLEVFDLSDYDVISARTDSSKLKLIITGRSVGTSEIYLEPITTYGFDCMEFVIPVITVNVVRNSPGLIGGHCAHADMEPADQKEPTDTEAGYRQYYVCRRCGAYLWYADETELTEIVDIDAWKAKGGDGYLPKRSDGCGEVTDGDVPAAPPTGDGIVPVSVMFAVSCAGMALCPVCRRKKNRVK